MNGWRALLSTSGLLLALAAGHACSTGGEPAPASVEESEGEIEQLADGCGARRYRDTTHITCTRGGFFSGDYRSVDSSCTQGDEDHITCYVHGFGCDWKAAEVTTYCAEGASACEALLPGRPAQHQPLVFDLPEGSKLCVPGQSTDIDRDSYCFLNRADYLARAKAQCEAQVEQHDTDTSCCISCTIPAPGPGATSSSTCELDGGPIGEDAGPIPADAGVGPPDAIVEHVAQ